MGCLASTNFAVLINGSPASFFKVTRGLHQGCPLSPLLFILVIEGLSHLIHQARDEGLIAGVKVSQNHHISHLLFVDDVLLLEWGLNRNGSTSSSYWIHSAMLLVCRSVTGSLSYFLLI